MLNAAQFSAAKNSAETKMLQSLVFDENKVRKGYSAFKNDAKEVTDIFNEPWLRTEYDTSVRQAVTGEQFRRYRDDKDIYPYWRYLRTISLHPRDEHLKLVGNVYRIGDPEGDRVAPPDGFNCLPAGSLVLTPKGWIEIQDILPNQAIIGGSGNECNVSFVHKNMFDGSLVNIFSKYGSVLYTDNHRVLTTKGWVRSDAINKYDILINVRKEGLNPAICYINNCYAFGCNKIMAFAIKWKARMIKGFDSYIKLWDKHINPVFSDIKIVNRVKRPEIIQNRLLVFSGVGPEINMRSWVCNVPLNSAMQGFQFNIFSKPGRSNFKFFRNSPKRGIRFFCFTKIVMGKFSSGLIKILACFLFPIICIYPLCLYAISGISNRYIKFLKYFRDNSIIGNSPTLIQFLKSDELNSVQFMKNFGDAAPLNKFDSFDMFLYTSWFHNAMQLVADIKIQKYSGFVYNLTVENDVSFITKIGIVHNCGCSTEQLSDMDMEENGYKARTSDEAREDLKDVNPQFRFNPADQGILPKESHSYFEALPNANDANGTLFNITESSGKNITGLSAKGLHNLVEQVHKWKVEYHSDVKGNITFQNNELYTNIIFNHKSFKNIQHNSAGFEQLADTVTDPDECWSSWKNSDEQTSTLRNYIKGNYVVKTQDGIIINAYLVDNVNRFRVGCLVG